MAWKYKKINIRYKISLPDGELAASLRYLSQRFGMPDQKSKAILNDIRNRRMGSTMLSIAKDSDYNLAIDCKIQLNELAILCKICYTLNSN